jgi:LytS/YehU family sensor histidine kinase
MKSVTAVLLILALASAAMGAELPSAPRPVEHDPGAWAFTTGFASTITGTFTKPWIGLATGVTIGIAANLQDSKNARQNMVGGIAGAVGGYVLIKTLKRDWHRQK